jgi:diadenosine tetraphosphate (Ap4A) HIT family hydrolase
MKRGTAIGNSVPHLHWLLAPRFTHDVAPGKPLPSSGYITFSEDEVRGDAIALQEILNE